eukprot:TRINITY_DN5360_c0_g1_i2.p1 TRINITY_DN5360_c0_g1~~TRINITY_DN5360_c0_g1_i2.p1  ORF type:complete len:390 (-),score=81.50 TRINITY_DN5360_c0_g1_i2:148-1317(-)
MVDLVMTYCVVVGCFGTFSGAIGTTLFRQRLEPPWLHRRMVMMLAGGFYLYLGLYDLGTGLTAFSETVKENDCEPSVSVATGFLKSLVGAPFLFVPQMFKFLRLNTADTQQAAKKPVKRIQKEDAQVLLNQQWWESISNTVAISLIALGFVELVYSLFRFINNIPEPYDYTAVWDNRFDYRVDNAGNLHDLTNLCKVQKTNLLLNIGMAIWVLYSLCFSLAWRISAWSSITRIQNHQERTVAAMRQRMAGTEQRPDKAVSVPPAWAASKADWVAWIAASDLAVVKLEEILGSTILTKGEAQVVAVKIAKQAVYGNFNPAQAISVLTKRGDTDAAEAIEEAVRGDSFEDVDDEFMETNLSIHERMTSDEKNVAFEETTEAYITDDDEDQG